MNIRTVLLPLTFPLILVGCQEQLAQNTDEKIHQTYGGGFRYLVARQLGFKAGIDVAKRPDEWATYIQFGSAW